MALTQANAIITFDQSPALMVVGSVTRVIAAAELATAPCDRGTSANGIVRAKSVRTFAVKQLVMCSMKR